MTVKAFSALDGETGGLVLKSDSINLSGYVDYRPIVDIPQAPRRLFSPSIRDAMFLGRGERSMTAVDLAKALAVAALILALDLACAFAFVSIWANWVEPGHPREFYVAAAPGLSTISTRIAGPLLFVLFVWLFSRKKVERNPAYFAIAVFVFYVFLDGTTVAFQGFFNRVVLVSLALKLTGAIVGAALARPRAQMT